VVINWRTGVIAVVALAFSSGVGVRGQQPASRSVSGFGPTLASVTVTVDAMLREGRLDIVGVQRDSMIPGRTHERLGQRYEGLPVFGGELIRQMDGRRVVSVFGRIFENVSLPAIEPSIDAASAAAIAEAGAGDGAVARAPELGVLAQAEACVLVYRMEVRSPWDIQTYDVNARTGARFGASLSW
jgi:Zn-dependent metalloprotease